MAEVELLQVQDERVMTRVFGGYSRYKAPVPSNAGYNKIELADCMNMASEQYPCAWVREKRQTLKVKSTASDTGYADSYLESFVDVISINDKIVYLDEYGEILCQKNRWDGRVKRVKNLLQFGEGVFCPQDGHYIQYITTNGGIEKWADFYVLSKQFNISYTDETGTNIPDAADAATAPTSPAPVSGDYYHNTTDGKLYKYNGSSWVAVTSGYYHNTTNGGVYHYENGTWAAYEVRHMKLRFATAEDGREHAEYVTRNLSAQDCVKLDDNGSASYVIVERVTPVREVVNGVNTTVNVDIIINTVLNPGSRLISISRMMPEMDYGIVHDNRVWGCRYGVSDGQLLNEIYACRLGDPLNWYYLQGLIEDSFTAGCGEPGDWTGCAVIGDNVVFFKEHCMYTVYGDTPATYTIKMDYCPGIKKGCEKSVVLINGYTYYNSPNGVMRMTSGSMPVKISDSLMYKAKLENAIGGTDGRKYYLYAYDSDQKKNFLYIYDTETNEWHIEDVDVKDMTNERLVALVPYKRGLLSVNAETKEKQVFGFTVSYDVLDFTFISKPLALDQIPMLYMGRWIGDEFAYPDDETYDYDTDCSMELVTEDGPEWSFVTANFGLDAVDYKRVKSISIRAWLDTGASFSTEIMYDDDGTWHELETSRTFSGGETGTNRVEYRLRRCDLYRLRISGTGRACIYSITHVVEPSGDRSYGTDNV